MLQKWLQQLAHKSQNYCSHCQTLLKGKQACWLPWETCSPRPARSGCRLVEPGTGPAGAGCRQTVSPASLSPPSCTPPAPGGTRAARGGNTQITTPGEATVTSIVWTQYLECCEFSRFQHTKNRVLDNLSFDSQYMYLYNSSLNKWQFYDTP